MARQTDVKVRITGDSKGAERAAKRTESAFARMGAVIKANALKIAAALASVVLAFNALRKAADLRGQTVALQRAVATQGVAYDSWIAKLREVSEAQIDTATLIDVSSNAIARGIKAAQIPELLEVARAKAIETGKDMTQVFADLSLGIARQSPMIIENAAIIIKLGEAYEEYARRAKKATDELTAQERTQAILEATIRAGQSSIEQFGNAQDEMAKRLAQAAANMKNLKTSAANLASGLIQMTAGGVAAFVTGISLAAEGVLKLARGIVFIGKLFPVFNTLLTGAGDALKNMDDGMDAFQKKAAGLAVNLSKGGVALVKLGLGFESAGTGAENLATKLDQAGGAADTAAGHFKTTTEAAIGLGNALGEVTSIELVLQIDKINEALAESKETLDANSDEYIRLERIAGEKIARLRERIQNLRDGLGDLKTTTRESASAMIEYASDLDRAAVATDRLTTSATRNASALQEQRAAAGLSPAGGSPSVYGAPPGGTFTWFTPVSQEPDGRIIIGLRGF